MTLTGAQVTEAVDKLEREHAELPFRMPAHLLVAALLDIDTADTDDLIGAQAKKLILQLHADPESGLFTPMDLAGNALVAGIVLAHVATGLRPPEEGDGLRDPGLVAQAEARLAAIDVMRDPLWKNSNLSERAARLVAQIGAALKNDDLRSAQKEEGA